MSGTSLAAAVARAFAPVADEIDAGRLPGAALGAVDAAGAREVVVAGCAQLEPDRAPMMRETWFDLASLTKPMLTTEVLLEQARRGDIDLDQPLGEMVPHLRQHAVDAAERQLTVRQCLSHRTFLPAFEPLYLLGLDAPTLEAYVLQREWPRGPAVYSDINFILLGIVAAHVDGRPLRDRALPDGLGFDPPADACAATERCPWRRRVLRGEVHDENAFAFGGVAGHAGLFGTIDGVLSFAGELLRDLRDPASARGRLLLAAEASDRTLGWQMCPPGWPGGSHTSARAIGHTGFTGTGLWIDPDQGLAWALLTNRVHPTRHGPPVITALRPAVGNLLLGAAAEVWKRAREGREDCEGRPQGEGTTQDHA